MERAGNSVAIEYVESDVAQRLDRLPWSRWHWLVVLALGITWILDELLNVCAFSFHCRNGNWR